MTEPSPAEAEFEIVAGPLIARGASRSQMMGTAMLTVGGRMFACLDDDAIAVKLGRDTEEHAEALALPGSRVFHPGGGSRRFHDWVSIPLLESEHWDRFAATAMEYTADGGARR